MSLLKAAKNFFVKRPLIANGLISGSFYVGAELSQQTLTKKILTDKPQDIDKATLVRYALYGTLVYSPLLFYWYRWLDRFLPGSTKKTVVKKLLIDQFLFTPPLLGVFYTTMSAMERKEDIFEECRQKFVPTFARSCLFWLPAQTINFAVIPSQFRVVYVSSCAFVWVNILCWVKRGQIEVDDVAEDDAANKEL